MVWGSREITQDKTRDSRRWSGRVRIIAMSFLALLLAIFMMEYFDFLSSGDYISCDAPISGTLLLVFNVCITTSFISSLFGFLSSLSKSVFSQTYQVLRAVLITSGVINFFCFLIRFDVYSDETIFISLAGLAIACVFLRVIYSEHVRLLEE